jgi:hypothetical protein
MDLGELGDETVHFLEAGETAHLCDSLVDDFFFPH